MSVIPDGMASGHLVLDVDGLGQIESDVGGTCTRTEGDLDMDLTAGSATDIRITIRPSATDLVMDDGGVQVAAQLGVGAVQVSGDELRVDAPLVTSDSATGNLSMTVRCRP